VSLEDIFDSLHMHEEAGRERNSTVSRMLPCCDAYSVGMYSVPLDQRTQSHKHAPAAAVLPQQQQLLLVCVYQAAWIHGRTLRRISNSMMVDALLFLISCRKSFQDQQSEQPVNPHKSLLHA
jgi:hypothetical protein